MRLGGNQNPELSEPGCRIELSLVAVDLQFTDIVEDSLGRNRPYYIGIEGGIQSFGRGDAVDVDSDLADVTVALYFTAAGGCKSDFHFTRERKRNDIEIDCGDCQN